MQFRRRVWILATSITVLGLAALLIGKHILGRSMAINEEGFNRIQLGVTQAEVEAILGGQPGYYATRDSMFYIASVHRMQKDPPSSGTMVTWSSNEAQIYIWFNTEGKVIFKDYLLGIRIEESFFKQIIRMLPW